MFALGNSLFACGVRSAHKRSFEEASGEMDVGRRRLPPPLAPEPAHWRRGHAPPVRKPNPNLNQRPSPALFCLKLGNSSCYARYICGNNCSVVVKLVQEYRCFLYILLSFCGNSSLRTIRFLGKRMVTSECSR